MPSPSVPTQPVAGPGVAETHISTVLFTADRAYKLLKPIKTSFLDYTTTSQRLAAVDEELRLNRRLSPDVYLGSADVVENDEVVDRMLVMRRLPGDQRLPALIDTQSFGDQLRAVARAVAVFHSRLEPLYDTVEIAGRDAVRQNWQNNIHDLEAVVDTLIPLADWVEVQLLVTRFLEHREGLFAQRIAAGFVREGHGDLTAEDIFCTAEGPRILDCLAFDPKLRISDVLLDVAFLVMDLDRLSGPNVASRFMTWYREFTNEHHPAALAHHYVAYRAHVRAKVAALRFAQGDRSQAVAVRDYHDLCLRHLRRSNLSVVLVGGTPGTGKSTLASSLSAALGAILLSTDELRKHVVGRPHLETTGHGDGSYTEQITEETYRELLREAGQLLDRGESVVLDGSWNKALFRAAARQLAEAKGADFAEVRCTLDQEMAKERITRRLTEGVDPQSAPPDLIDELVARFEPWPTALAVDAARARHEMVEHVLQHLARLTTGR